MSQRIVAVNARSAICTRCRVINAPLVCASLVKFATKPKVCRTKPFYVTRDAMKKRNSANKGAQLLIWLSHNPEYGFAT